MPERTVPANSPEIPVRGSRAQLLRWLLSYGAFGVPQAAAPIAFGLVTLNLIGSADAGAALVFAMTLAQIAGALPAARLGRWFHPAKYLRALIAIRTIALISVALLAAVSAPLWGLVAAAAVAGSLSGAAYGYLRSALNHLVEPQGMTRALGVAATINEVTFVVTPVAVATVGAVAPWIAVLAGAVLGALPLVVLPAVGSREARARRAPQGQLVTPKGLLWLTSELALGASVAGVEIGAVPLALDFGLAPAWSAIFPLALCVASVGGGIWVSVRNRRVSNGAAAAMLLIAAAGGGLIAFSHLLVTTLAGTILIGACLAPLVTHFAVALDDLTPPDRRPEAFALLRTAGSLGIVVTSGTTAIVGLAPAILFSAALALVLALAVGVMSALERGSFTPRMGVRLGRKDT